jgi:predicted PurR-regulated permease PerM
LLRWLVGQVGNLTMVFVQLLLIVTLCAVLYSKGEVAAEGIRAFARRLDGSRGDQAVLLAARAVRAVALGVIVVAAAQAALAAIGRAVAGVPRVGLLTILMFILGVAQLGPGLVLIPAVIWLYWNGDVGWGTALLVWSIPVILFDGLMRPIVIKKSASLPLLLIFAGVIGGLIAFGVMGIFIGPVVLAVSYTLLIAWVKDSHVGLD